MCVEENFEFHCVKCVLKVKDHFLFLENQTELVRKIYIEQGISDITCLKERHALESLWLQSL